MSKLPAKIQSVVEDPKQFISRLKIMHKQKQRLTDFSMNKPQEDLLKVLKTENRVIILKARQMGISTLTRGYHFWKAYTSDQPTQYAVISHTRASAEELHRMEKTFYENLPSMLRKPLSRASANTLTFKDSGASVKTYTAGGKGGTRSFAMNAVHLSEFAFYEDQDEVMATVMAAVGDGQIVIESTPNRTGDRFHQLVKDAAEGKNEWTLVFFPWFANPIYTRGAQDWYKPNDSETRIALEHGLTRNQLFWRMQQQKSLGGEKFVREYPATITEAFRSTGVNFFDLDALDEIQDLECGSREHRQISAPIDGEAYVIGVDVGAGAGAKSDYSAVSVVSVSTRQPVYHFISNRTPPAHLAEEIVKIYERYGKPKIIVESNGNGSWVIHRLRQLKVKGLYKDPKNQKDFRMSVRTRPLVFQAIKAVMDGGVVLAMDKLVKEELKNIVYIRDKPQAKKGKHDDVMISLGLCYYLLEDTSLNVHHSVRSAIMDKHIQQLRAKKANRACPWNIRGGNSKGGWK